MEKLLEGATEEQRAAILHKNGPAFVTAPAGAGKTLLITRRCARILDADRPPNIVGITFTNKAANEMRERVKKLVDPRLVQFVWLSTFHSYCVSILRKNPVCYRVRSDFGIADESDSKDFVTLAMAHVTGRSEKDVRKYSGTGDVQHVRKWISHHKNGLRLPGDLKDLGKEVKFREFIPYYERYRELLAKNNLLDFDDLIMQVVLGLRASEEEQDKFAEHLHYLMVDEYQDTNLAQFEFIKLITQKRGNVFVVGDLAQSIYGFRGADAQNADKFFQTFPEATIYHLRKNFRSRPGIIEAANLVIKHNKHKYSTEVVPVKTGGAKPELHELKNPEDEAAFIFSTIKALVQQGGASWKDFAVLYRIRSLSRALEDEAVARNIPYRVVGSINFYSRAAIKDILAYARLLIYPHDNAAFTRIHNKPSRGIGPVNFARFVAEADEDSLMKTLRLARYVNVVNGPALTGFRKLKAIFAQLREVGVDQAAPAIEAIVKQSGYLHFAENLRDVERSERMVEDLHELVAAAAAFDQSGKRKKGLAAFLEHAVLMQHDDKERDEDVVLLMTAHAAKGLEFPCVFVCGAVEGVLPLKPRSDDGEPVIDTAVVKAHYAEERRVFYVAVTRAEERLFITFPSIRRFGADVASCTPSRFAQEAKEALAVHLLDEEDRPSYYQKRPARQYGKSGASRQGSRQPKIPDGGVDDIIRSRQAGGEAARREQERRRLVDRE